jgi:hypothetical protein
MEASSRRWNRVIIWSLAFVVASVFAMTLTPQPGHAAFREHKDWSRIACRGEHFLDEGGQAEQRPWFFLQ